MPPSAASPLLLSRRSDSPPEPPQEPILRLALSAEERTRLRGQRFSRCGRALLLQLQRGAPLRPGEWLRGSEAEPEEAVLVEAAEEALLVVRAAQPLDLLRAAYHLGNRHVALEVRPDELRLLEDPVLASLLEGLGLEPRRCIAPFLPEGGAYGGGAGHSHGHHDHAHRDQTHQHQTHRGHADGDHGPGVQGPEAQNQHDQGQNGQEEHDQGHHGHEHDHDRHDQAPAAVRSDG